MASIVFKRMVRHEACGHLIPYGTKTCPYCNNVDVIDREQVVPESKTEEPSTFNWASLKKPLLIAAIVLAVVACIALITSLVGGKKSSETENKEENTTETTVDSSTSLLTTTTTTDDTTADTEEEYIEDSAQSLYGLISLSGKINGKYGVVMNLDFNNNVVSGSYYYQKQGPSNTISLNGGFDGTNLRLVSEYESFELVFDGNDSFSGQWYGNNGKVMSTYLTVR